jgi:voltage-gated potassium channel Kch
MLLSGLTITFLKEFGVGIWLTLPLLLSLAAIIVLLAQLVRKTEGWSRSDALYWSLITATTVGYGDLCPAKRTTRIISIVIAFLGVTLTGIMIAVAVHAATLALVAHDAATVAK